MMVGEIDLASCAGEGSIDLFREMNLACSLQLQRILGGD
jgi:hypothetical protein